MKKVITTQQEKQNNQLFLAVQSRQMDKFLEQIAKGSQVVPQTYKYIKENYLFDYLAAIIKNSVCIASETLSMMITTRLNGKWVKGLEVAMGGRKELNKFLFNYNQLALVGYKGIDYPYDFAYSED